MVAVNKLKRPGAAPSGRPSPWAALLTLALVLPAALLALALGAFAAGALAGVAARGFRLVAGG